MDVITFEICDITIQLVNGEVLFWVDGTDHEPDVVMQIDRLAPHIGQRETAQLLKKVLAHARELEENLRYVEAYLESAAESEDDSGLMMSAKPLLGDVRKILRSNAALTGGEAVRVEGTVMQRIGD